MTAPGPGRRPSRGKKCHIALRERRRRRWRSSTGRGEEGGGGAQGEKKKEVEKHRERGERLEGFEGRGRGGRESGYVGVKVVLGC